MFSFGLLAKSVSVSHRVSKQVQETGAAMSTPISQSSPEPIQRRSRAGPFQHSNQHSDQHSPWHQSNDLRNRDTVHVVVNRPPQYHTTSQTQAQAQFQAQSPQTNPRGPATWDDGRAAQYFASDFRQPSSGPSTSSRAGPGRSSASGISIGPIDPPPPYSEVDQGAPSTAGSGSDRKKKKKKRQIRAKDWEQWLRFSACQRSLGSRR
ncbi:Hypothetical predicted protein [Lecanosticta acicola]|uniref:Uncharacterized protein n=1 Tax=Lecanosticta acicola TaxID=111012 RepID=A0AAI9EE75_9PEZI|nr:Hypothetical predicted protein [Lecanosticta acicola]